MHKQGDKCLAQGHFVRPFGCKWPSWIWSLSFRAAFAFNLFMEASNVKACCLLDLEVPDLRRWGFIAVFAPGKMFPPYRSSKNQKENPPAQQCGGQSRQGKRASIKLQKQYTPHPRSAPFFSCSFSPVNSQTMTRQLTCVISLKGGSFYWNHAAQLWGGFCIIDPMSVPEATLVIGELTQAAANYCNDYLYHLKIHFHC